MKTHTSTRGPPGPCLPHWHLWIGNPGVKHACTYWPDQACHLVSTMEAPWKTVRRTHPALTYLESCGEVQMPVGYCQHWPAIYLPLEEVFKTSCQGPLPIIHWQTTLWNQKRLPEWIIYDLTSCETSERRSLRPLRPSSHDHTRLVGYPSSGRKLILSLYLRRDPNTKLPTTAQFLTCVRSKMFEHSMVNQINRHLKERSIVTHEQHGFWEGLSCDNQLTNFDHDFHTMISAHRQVYCIVMDFSKALARCHIGGSSQAQQIQITRQKPQLDQGLPERPLSTYIHTYILFGSIGTKVPLTSRSSWLFR